MLEFSKSTNPKARKEYVCDLCKKTICKGEVYHRYSGKYDGEMFDDKYHTICDNIIQAYCNDEGEREYSEDAIYDWLHDTYCYDCKHYRNDKCTEYPITCPYIMERYKLREEK